MDTTNTNTNINDTNTTNDNNNINNSSSSSSDKIINVSNNNNSNSNNNSNNSIILSKISDMKDVGLSLVKSTGEFAKIGIHLYVSIYLCIYLTSSYQ
jgi:hypothetical protein